MTDPTRIVAATRRESGHDAFDDGDSTAHGRTRSRAWRRRVGAPAATDGEGDDLGGIIDRVAVRADGPDTLVLLHVDIVGFVARLDPMPDQRTALVDRCRAAIRRAVPPVAFVGRLDGRLVVVLPGQTVTDAVRLSQRLRAPIMAAAGLTAGRGPDVAIAAFDRAVRRDDVLAAARDLVPSTVTGG